MWSTTDGYNWTQVIQYEARGHPHITHKRARARTRTHTHTHGNRRAHTHTRNRRTHAIHTHKVIETAQWPARAWASAVVWHELGDAQKDVKPATWQTATGTASEQTFGSATAADSLPRIWLSGGAYLGVKSPGYDHSLATNAPTHAPTHTAYPP